MGPKVLAKASLTRLGRTAPRVGVRAAERALDYLALGSLLRRHGMLVDRRVASGEDFDADLYSSTFVALEAVAEAVRPGAYLYFDELADRANELRALDEFLLATGRTFDVVGVTDTYTQWLFECER